MLAVRGARLTAGEAAFRQGAADADRGAVRSLRFTRGTLTARVRGSRRYHVAIHFDDELHAACDCPVGEEGAFCRHCVAAVVSWLDSI